MTLLLNIVGVGLLFITFIELLINPYKALALSLLCLTSDYDVIIFNYNFAAKALALLCCLVCFKRNFKKQKLSVVYVILLFMFLELFNFIAKISLTYTFSDFITSFATIFLGICIFMVSWPDQERLYCFKILSWIPLYLVLAGSIYNTSIFVNHKISTISLLSHLPFWCTFGFISAYQIYTITNRRGYLYLGIIDVLIVFLTSSRGGAIFAVILLVPFIMDMSKKLDIKLLKRVIVFLPAIIAVACYGLLSVIGKSFSTGKLNTSNRLIAWKYILELSSENRIFGLGLGSLKTTTDSTLIGLGYTAAHNEYVRFIYETGIVGLIIIIIMFMLMFRIFIKDSLLHKRWIYAIILGFMIYSITDNTISAVSCWAPFTTVLSLCRSD